MTGLLLLLLLVPVMAGIIAGAKGRGFLSGFGGGLIGLIGVILAISALMAIIVGILEDVSRAPGDAASEASKEPAPSNASIPEPRPWVHFSPTTDFSSGVEFSRAISERAIGSPFGWALLQAECHDGHYRFSLETSGKADLDSVAVSFDRGARRQVPVRRDPAGSLVFRPRLGDAAWFNRGLSASATMQVFLDFHGYMPLGLSYSMSASSRAIEAVKHHCDSNH